MQLRQFISSFPSEQNHKDRVFPSYSPHPAPIITLAHHSRIHSVHVFTPAAFTHPPRLRNRIHRPNEGHRWSSDSRMLHPLAPHASSPPPIVYSRPLTYSQLHSHPCITAQMSKRLPPPAGGRRGRRQIRAPAPKTNNTAAPCTCVQTSIRVAWPRPRIAGRVTAAQCGSGPFGTGAAGGEPPPPPSLKPKASSEASRHPRKSSRRIRACGRPASPPG